MSRSPKLSLATLFLLIAATGSWVAYLQAQFALTEAKRSNSTLQEFARELKVEDLRQVVAIRKSWSSIDHASFEVHIPGIGYRLHVRSSESLETFELPAGEHSIDLDQARASDLGATIGETEGVVFLDGQPILSLESDNNSPSRTTYGEVDKLTVRWPNELPLVLLKTQANPASPIMWIDRVAGN